MDKQITVGDLSPRSFEDEQRLIAKAQDAKKKRNAYMAEYRKKNPSPSRKKPPQESPTLTPEQEIQHRALLIQKIDRQRELHLAAMKRYRANMSEEKKKASAERAAAYQKNKLCQYKEALAYMEAHKNG